MTADTLHAGVLPKQPSMRRLIVAATIGNIFEWFDFVVYGFFAVTIAEVFFPAGNPTVSLLITFGAFGLAYFVRPLGAIVVGGYTDRAGRKAGLLLSMALMMIGTTLMAVTPGFATIGLAAPIIITIARLLQGFSVGGEFGSAVSFLAEHGGGRRGFSASWQFATGGLITVLASLFGLTLSSLLTHEQLVDWGWRIPYVFGMLIGPAGLYVRAKVVETPEFLEAEKPATIPIRDVLRRHPLPVLLALGISIISNSSFYILAYIPTYGVKTLHLPASTGFTATLIGGAILAIGCPLAGYWSDKLPRRTLLMVITCWLFVLTSYPAFYLMAAWPSLAACIIAVGWLQFVKAGYSGVLPSVLSEQFPVAVRAIGVSLGFSTAVSVFGGLAPLVATWLIAATGDSLSPSFYLIFTALLSLFALMAIQSRGRPVTRAISAPRTA
ncbi:MAG TPA: MFS transporter [Stellaceae bacterium]|jgi:MHS family proline/betaine transporter-like MFS transporter|nr:MFS transporter [Stellaceae bacterium]